MKKHDPETVVKRAVSLELVHRLLELADQYHVHVVPTMRNEMLRLQDRVIQAINLVTSERIKAE